jgi:hypothetical protein
MPPAPGGLPSTRRRPQYAGPQETEPVCTQWLPAFARNKTRATGVTGMGKTAASSSSSSASSSASSCLREKNLHLTRTFQDEDERMSRNRVHLGCLGAWVHGAFHRRPRTSSLGARSSACRASARRTGGAETKTKMSGSIRAYEQEARGTGRGAVQGTKKCVRLRVHSSLRSSRGLGPAHKFRPVARRGVVSARVSPARPLPLSQARLGPRPRRNPLRSPWFSLICASRSELRTNGDGAVTTALDPY